VPLEADRRKLIPSLEHVTWSDPTVTLSALAISSRLAPWITRFRICSMRSGVNLVGLRREGVGVEVSSTISVSPTVVALARYLASSALSQVDDRNTFGVGIKLIQHLIVN
jgi:hypothetical protein